MADPHRKHNVITVGCWCLLVGAGLSGLITNNWDLAFLSFVVFGMTLLPFLFEAWSDVSIPDGFIAAIAVFIVGTIFLGEVGDFYERFWWWDVVLHTASAVAFALIGMLVVLSLLKGDRLAAPPIMLAIMAFSFAVSIGAMWEIFEFVVDQVFGTNMQKSGLDDTMNDLIVDSLGAFVGSSAGYIYLKSRGQGFLSSTIESFVERNPHIFQNKT